MKFGNVIHTLVAICSLAAGTVHAAPAYYFGNAPTANGVYPSGCPDTGNANCAPLAANTSFGSNVLVTAAEGFEGRVGGPIPNNSIAVLQAAGGSTSTGTLSQTQFPSAQFYQGGSIVNGGSSDTGRFNTTNGAATGGWFETDWSFAIDLNSSVQAFGFFGTDFNDFAGTLSIRLLLDGIVQYTDVFDGYNADTKSTAIDPLLGTPNGSLVFFGFTSDEKRFDRIEFVVSQSPNTPFGDWDYLGFDDIVVGNLRDAGPTPAPEPGSLALAGLALFAAGYARKARKTA